MCYTLSMDKINKQPFNQEVFEMKVMYSDLQPNQHTCPVGLLIEFINQHGCSAFLLRSGILAVSDGVVSNLIPTSVRATKKWLNY